MSPESHTSSICTPIKHQRMNSGAHSIQVRTRPSHTFRTKRCRPTRPTDMKSPSNRTKCRLPHLHLHLHLQEITRIQWYVSAEQERQANNYFCVGGFALGSTCHLDDCDDCVCYCYRTGSAVYTSHIDTQFRMG
jgi:hypothetical protein